MSGNQKGFPTVFALAMVTLLSCFSPVSSYFTLPRVSRTSDAIIIDCKFFIFFFLYNLKIGFNLISYLKFQMKVWDILHFPWAEATANMLIQDSFHSQHSILTACSTMDGLILVGKHHQPQPQPQQLLAVEDHLQSHDQRSAKGSKALALPQSHQVGGGRSW